MKRSLGAALVVILTLVAAAVAGDFTDLARRMPENANVIGMIDLSGLLSSPLGKSSGWANKPELTSLPTTIDQIVVSGHYNPTMGGYELRHGAARLAKPVTLSSIAKKYAGTVTEIGGHSAVMTPQNLAIVELADGVLGLHMSTDRQENTRMVKMADANTTLVVNPYLREAAREIGAAQIRFALDTGDLFDPNGAKHGAAALTALGGDGGKIASVARAFSAMKGITFSIRVDNEIHGVVRVDFGNDIQGLASVAAPVLKEFLRGQGLYLADFDNWKTDVRGKSIYFEGAMSESGLRQAMTALLSTSQSMHSLQSPGSQTDSAAAVSKRYFNGAANLIEDLRSQMKELRSSKEFAYWYEHTARRIDQLPSVGVDEELVQYGGTVADKLRAMGANIRGVSIDVNKMMSYKRSAAGISNVGGHGMAWGYHYGYHSGGVWFNNNYAHVAEMQSEAIAQGAKDRVGIGRSLDADAGEIRRAMSRKYGVEF